MIGIASQSVRETVSIAQVVKTLEETNLEVLSDFTNKALERQLPDEQLGGLLVATNFTKSDSTRPETMGLLDTTSCRL